MRANRALFPFELAYLALLVIGHPLRAGEQPALKVTPVPRMLEEALNLDPVYKKHVSADGFPILSSRHVSDYALLEAAYPINHILVGRDDIRQALIKSKTRFVVMAPTEFTTDVPEHSDLQPSRFWDRRARGLGATCARPVVSCGEENLLCYEGDHYDHNHVDTRKELKQYDPDLAALIAEVFGDRAWRYRRPDQRKHAGHLAGFDRSAAPRFCWPPELVEWYEEYQRQEGD